MSYIYINLSRNLTTHSTSPLSDNSFCRTHIRVAPLYAIYIIAFIRLIVCMFLFTCELTTRDIQSGSAQSGIGTISCLSVTSIFISARHMGHVSPSIIPPPNLLLIQVRHMVLWQQRWYTGITPADSLPSTYVKYDRAQTGHSFITSSILSGTNVRSLIKLAFLKDMSLLRYKRYARSNSDCSVA